MTSPTDIHPIIDECYPATTTGCIVKMTLSAYGKKTPIQEFIERVWAETDTVTYKVQLKYSVSGTDYHPCSLTQTTNGEISDDGFSIADVALDTPFHVCWDTVKDGLLLGDRYSIKAVVTSG